MRIIVSLLLLFLTACSTTTKAPSPVPEEEIEAAPSSPRKKGTRPPYERPVSIDYEGLQKSLGLNRAYDRLGYVEKSFSTCEAGYGYLSSQDCRQEHFVLIHFRLMCRDSVGTISTVLTDADLTPLRRKTITWDLQKGMRGTLQLDNDGYGQIKTTAANSARSNRLKITIGNDFLYLRAGEIKRVVAPGNWCDL